MLIIGEFIVVLANPMKNYVGSNSNDINSKTI